ncbi:MAG: B12-binding domain-containing radical SAM protein [Candidatus Xenobiia bacterium LiM19]
MHFKSALCIRPETHRNAPVNKFLPPIGLEIIATVMNNAGVAITIVDLRHEKSLSPYLKDFDVDNNMIAISVNWDYEIEMLPELLREMPDGAFVVLGGRSATTHVEEIFRDNQKVSCIVRGDGEEIIRELVEGRNLDEIEGLSFRKDSQVIHNKSRELEDMDNDLIVNRDLRRQHYALEDAGIDMDFISTSRGCPFSCKFCSFSNNPLGQKRKWTGRSPESVIKELKTIKAGTVIITDDNFAVDARRVEKICDLIIENGIKKNFIAAVRIEISKHPVMLEKMARAGIRMLLIGIESATDRILDMMNKGFTKDEALKAFKVIRKYNFFIHGFLIIGNFTETEDEMLQIPVFSNELDLDSISVLVLRTDKYNPLNEYIKEYPGYHIVFNNNELQIYSDSYSVHDLDKIRIEITRRYFTPWNILKFFRRLVGTGFIRFSHLATYARRLLTGKSKLVIVK